MGERDEESQATTKVQEVAANMQQIQASRKRISGAKAETIARRYFAAIDAHDADTAVALWAEGAHDNVRGRFDVVAPDGVRDFLTELFAAMPDLDMEVVSTTAQGERCGVHWRLRGTFAGPGGFGGIAPTGSSIDLEGFDLVTVSDGLIQANDAFTDNLTFARQVGMLPAQGSTADLRMTGAFNAGTRLKGLGIGSAELVAEGVWVVQGQPGRCNVYLLEDDGGVTLFDAGGRTMTRSLATAGARLGGIKRVVLGHGHTDHRGSAPGLGVPVYCHANEVEDAEGSGGFRYWPEGLVGLPLWMRVFHKLLHRYAWDGGPVTIEGTVAEGDEVAGFTVIDLPGHAPGQIGLWRESDRLALSTDCFYTLDMLGRDSEAHIPESTYNYDTDQARASILKLAEMEPAAAWPGHAKPLTGDVRGQLERAAAGG